MRYVALTLCLTAASIVFACGGGSSSSGPGPSGSDGGTAGAGDGSNDNPGGASTGGSTTAGTAGTGATSNNDAGGEGGGPGIIGVESHAKPRSGYGNVVGGEVSHSKNFTMILSVGEEPGGNLSMGSSSYRINLGVVGSTQK